MEKIKKFLVGDAKLSDAICYIVFSVCIIVFAILLQADVLKLSKDVSKTLIVVIFYVVGVIGLISGLYQLKCSLAKKASLNNSFMKDLDEATVVSSLNNNGIETTKLKFEKGKISFSYDVSRYFEACVFVTSDFLETEINLLEGYDTDKINSLESVKVIATLPILEVKLDSNDTLNSTLQKVTSYVERNKDVIDTANKAIDEAIKF